MTSDSKGVRIVRLSADDWARYRAIRLRALRDAPSAFARTLAEEARMPPERWRTRFHDDAATFVADRGGADVGLATGARWLGREGVAGLFGMWVAPGQRGRGIGRALVSAVTDWARQTGFARIVLDVADRNAAAVALYAATGFAATGATGTLPPPREHVREHERALEL